MPSHSEIGVGVDFRPLVEMTRSYFRIWPETDLLTETFDVCFAGRSGHHPTRTSDNETHDLARFIVLSDMENVI